MLPGLQYAISKNKCVWKLDIKSNQLKKFATGAEGRISIFPTMLLLHKDGRLFVTESGAFRQVTGKIFCFDEWQRTIWHHGPFSFANGLALYADEKFLYVVCTWLPGVERIAINEDGSAGKREVYCTLPQTCPDGIAFDAGRKFICCLLYTQQNF